MSRAGERSSTRPTIHDVAVRAGVGVGTVSRYLNGSSALGESSRAAIASAVAALGYRPSQAGRALRRGTSGTIGVLVPTVSNPIFGLSLDGIESRLRAAGRSTIVATSGYDVARQRAALETLDDRGVDGLIATLCDPVPEQCAPLASRGLPFVLIYNDAPRGGGAAGRAGPDRGEAPTVTVDNFGAVRDATRRLVDAGHVCIAFLGGRFAASDRARARHAGYRHAMEDAGLPPWRPVELPFDASAEVFARVLAELLDRLHRPTALICSNDLLALQAIDAAGRLGLGVPDDLSVIGFDGMPMATFATPSLTTIRQPAREMGRIAAGRLLARLDGRDGGGRDGEGPGDRDRSASIVLPHTFVDGETVAPRRDGRAARPPDASTALEPSLLPPTLSSDR